MGFGGLSGVALDDIFSVLPPQNITDPKIETAAQGEGKVPGGASTEGHTTDSGIGEEARED